MSKWDQMRVLYPISSEINAIASAVRITGVPERLGETSFAGESLTTITHKFTAPEKYFPSPFALWVNTTGWAGLILQQYSIDPDSGIVQMDFYNTRANTFTTNPRVTALFQKQLYEEMQ